MPKPLKRRHLPLCSQKYTKQVRLRALVENLGPWPSALYGTNRPIQRREVEADYILRTRLKRLMTEKRIKAARIARALGVARASLSAVITGRKALPRAWMAPILHVLGVERNQLLEGIPWPIKHPRGREKGDGKRIETSEQRAQRTLLREQFTKRKLKQRQVAAFIGVRPSTVSEVLTGRTRLPKAWLKPLSQLLDNTTVSELGGAT